MAAAAAVSSADVSRVRWGYGPWWPQVWVEAPEAMHSVAGPADPRAALAGEGAPSPVAGE